MKYDELIDRINQVLDSAKGGLFGGGKVLVDPDEDQVDTA